MPDVIRIKRRASPGANGAPTSLANAELAYNENDHILYVGEGTGGGGGSASIVVPVGGYGHFAPKESPALTGTPTAPTVTPGTDNSTKLATTGFVQSAISAVSSGVTNITVQDGLSGGGTGAVTIGVSNNGLANAKLAQMPANTLKVNNTGSPATPIDGTVAQVMTMLNAASLSTRLDQFAAPNVAVAWNSQRITGLADPSSGQDAATKSYVDATVQGLDPKETARLATAAALPANTYSNGTAGVGATLTATSNGALSVDGVAVAAGDIVLVKNEASASRNGLYLVSVTGSGAQAYVLTRHTGMDTANEFSGAFVPVGAGGATNTNTLWLANPTTPVTVGTTNIPFTQLNAATTYTAGNGLTLTGNVLDVVGTANRISVAADSIDISTSYVGQASITTLGTVATGTWNGTTIAVANGGSGATTLTGHLKGNGTGAFTASATIPNTDITGLGTMATQNAGAVAITGGTIDGITFDGGTF